MRKLAVVLAVWGLVVAACASDTTDEVATPVLTVVGETPGYVPPDWLEPYVAVAVGSDDLPVVVFYDQSTDMVEYRRCVDSSCAESPVTAQIQVPGDQNLEWLALSIGPSDLPVITLEGNSIDDEGNWGPPQFYLASCVDKACSDLSWARFENEVHPSLGFTDAGTLVLASTEAEDPMDTRLVLRTCGDGICESEVSRADILVLPEFQRWELMIEPEGAPIAVGCIEAADGSGLISVIECSDALCSSHQTFLTETDHSTASCTAAAGELPVVAYGSASGIALSNWPESLDGDSTTISIDDTPADAHQIAKMASLGWSESPVIAYLRMLNIETDEETRQLVVVECAQADCSMGTRTVTARTTDDLGLETSPAVAIAPNGDTVIAFHTCPPGCSPQYINILRCEGGCATAFRDQIEATW